MTKILFVVKDMNIGGVERSLISVLNEINKEEYEITILLFENKGGFLNEIPKWIKVIELKEYKYIKSLVNNPPYLEIKNIFKEKKFNLGCRITLGYLLWKIFKKIDYYYWAVFKYIPNLNEDYDYAISYSSIINYLSYYVKQKVKSSYKIGWIHFDIEKINFDKDDLYSLHKHFKKIYVVSNEAYNNFIKTFPKLKNKCEVKKNIISWKFIQKESLKDDIKLNYNGLKIMTVGRLSKEKGQDLIPYIAQKLKEKNIDFKWYLIGDGKLKAEIKELIDKFELSENIVLLGSTLNPYSYLKKAEIYVQPSRYEGYCISLAEAKLFTLPIISTDFTGANEQLIHRKNGSIVRVSIESIYEELLYLIDNEYIRNRYKEELLKEREMLFENKKSIH